MMALEKHDFILVNLYRFGHAFDILNIGFAVSVGAAWRDAGENKDRKAFSSVLEMVRQVMVSSR